MDMALKKDLQAKLESITPEYGMVELLYSSFARCCGYRSQPLSAADTVEAVSALLDAAGGVQLEVEVEGARNGGEWFGNGKAWQSNGHSKRWRLQDRENIPPEGEAAARKENEAEEELETKKTVQWWNSNFWDAFDALNEYVSPGDLPFICTLTLHAKYNEAPRSTAPFDVSSQSSHPTGRISHRQARDPHYARTPCRDHYPRP